MQKIERVLVDCGASVSQTGFDYIVEAYKMVKDSYTMTGRPMPMSKVYAEIAGRHGKTAVSIERAIRWTVEGIYGSSIDVPGFLGPDKRTGKLASKEFICRLARYVK